MSFKEKLKANGQLIDVGFNSSPEVVDWNEDGLLDLLVGMDSNGQGPTPIRLYLNSGTKTEYKFTDFTTLKAGSIEIKHGRCQICVEDLNRDGKKDLIVGDNSGKFFFYNNKGTNSNPELESLGAIKSNGTTIKLDGDTRLTVDDWNSDGALDILAGDYYDNLYIIKGIPDGTHNSTISNPSKSLSFNIESLKPAYIAFNLNKSGVYNMSIYNAKGSLILSEKSSLIAGHNKLSFNQNLLMSGLYIVNLSNKENNVICKGIIK